MNTNVKTSCNYYWSLANSSSKFISLFGTYLLGCYSLDNRRDVLYDDLWKDRVLSSLISLPRIKNATFSYMYDELLSYTHTDQITINYKKLIAHYKEKNKLLPFEFAKNTLNLIQIKDIVDNQIVCDIVNEKEFLHLSQLINLYETYFYKKKELTPKTGNNMKLNDKLINNLNNKLNETTLNMLINTVDNYEKMLSMCKNTYISDIIFINFSWFCIINKNNWNAQFYSKICKILEKYSERSLEHAFLRFRFEKITYTIKIDENYNTKWLSWDKPKYSSCILHISEMEHFTRLCELFETTYNIKHINMQIYYHIKELENVLNDFMNRCNNMYSILENIFANANQNTHIVNEKVMKLINIKLQQNNLEKITQILENTKTFIAGSFVLELLHQEEYENSDIDIFCSYVDLQSVLDTFYNYGYKAYNITENNNDYDDDIIDNIYEYFDYITGKKVQIVALKYTYNELRLNFNKYVDFEQCSSRIFCMNKIFYIAGTQTMLSKTFKFSDNYLQELVLRKGIISLNRLEKRITKYQIRNFNINLTDLGKFFSEKYSLNCCICQHDVLTSNSLNNLYCTQCNHLYHFNCIYEWTSYHPGDQIQIAKSCCPLCKQSLIQNRELNVMNVSRYDFDHYNYVLCVVCSIPFISSARNNCETHDGNRIVCDDCMQSNDMGNVLKGKEVICPNCGIKLEHNGGCSQFTCCLYGNDRCYRDHCDHGSTDNIQFCGYRWNVS